MWVLECDGDFFQGRKLWLRPGGQYLFGRTKPATGPNERFHVIQNKSVSRKHVVISVSPVAPGQGQSVYSRSEVTVTDESKIGTQLDGETFTRTTRTLTKKEHEIRLGKWEQALRIKWQPAVLTFTFSDRDFKKSPDILARVAKKLEPFDIKAINEYVTDSTTHVITSKRNVPKSLQALTNGKYIVTEPFIDALVRAASSKGKLEDGSPAPSALEADFVASWPDAIEYLPGPGKEPHPQPPAKFAPKSERNAVFEGFTFIVADQSQYDNLSPFLMNGGAKCIKFDLKLGETRAKDLVRFVRDVAEKNGLNEVFNEDIAKAVVVVRFMAKGDLENWANAFTTELDLALEQRSVGQNEFLDAILQNDASPLKRRVETETQPSRPPASTAPEPSIRKRTRPDSDDDLERRRPSAVQKTRNEAEKENEDSISGRRSSDAQNTMSGEEQNRKEAGATAHAAAPPKGRIGRVVTKSRFKTFDDSDEEDLPAPSVAGASQPQVGEGPLEASGLATERSTNMEIDSQSLFVSDSQPQIRLAARSLKTGHKRPRSPSGVEPPTTQNMLDQLLPGAAAMKKRRLERGPQTESTPPSRERSTEADSTVSKRSSAKKATKQIEVRETARTHAQKLDEASKFGRPASRANSQNSDGDDDAMEAEDFDVSKLHDLAIIEEIELPVRRDRPQSRANGDSAQVSDGWDPRWNGLKNFKRFRRQGTVAVAANNRPRRVLVALEEVKHQDYGLGESYWLDSGTSQRRRKGVGQIQSQSQSQSQSQVPPVRTRGEEEDDATMDLEPEEVAGRPRGGEIADALALHTARAAGMRTAAPGAKHKEPSAKMQRHWRSAIPTQVVDESSSEEDELKFRFKGRK